MRLPMLALLLATAALGSCGIGTTYWATPEELEAFERAGPIELELDTDQLLSGVPKPGPYRLVAGDLLEIEGPDDWFRLGANHATGKAIHRARVGPGGSIQVPVIGAVDVRGKTIPEVEQAIAGALHPKFLVQRPSIVVRILDHHRVKVAILGAVEKPGVMELRSDQLSLYGALTEAGGILKASTLKVGARVIRIRRPGEDRAKALALPVKGLNLPFGDVALTGGETIEVERWEPELFTVVGLVQKPGAYEYPPESTYNLLQAVAIAGGVDRIANPPYATIFRKDADGKILAATFEIDGDGMAESSGTRIKPGDVIAIQHTAASWTRSLLAEVLRIQLGFFVEGRAID